MFIHNRAMLAAAGVSTAYVADAAVFDGTNDYIKSDGDIAAADGKSGMVSLWVKFNGGDGAAQTFWSVLDDSIHCQREASNHMRYYINTGSAYATTTSNLVVASGWTHVLMSWDVATGYSDIYFNDVQQSLSPDTTTNTTLNYTHANHWFMAARTAAQKMNADVFDFWIALNSTLDITVEANRRLFIDAAGKPVDLGADGSNPGITPRVFFHLDDGETANNFAINAGAGGTCTLTGSLTTASTSPTD